jgi:hypothetical protein
VRTFREESEKTDKEKKDGAPLASTATGPVAGAATAGASKYCTSCGKPNADGAKFCASCGTPLAA